MKAKITPNKLYRGKDVPKSTSKQIAHLKDVVEQIASRKSKGFIYMCKDLEKDGSYPGSSAVDGVLISNGVKPLEIVMNLIESAKLSHDDKMYVMLQLIKSVKDDI